MTPTLKRIVLSMAIALTLAASAVAATGWVATRPVGAVRVVGEFSEVSRATLRALIGPALEGGFFRVDVDEVRKAALTLPWVREVTVRRVWPDSIHVAVVERRAVARWNDNALLESDGSLFEPGQIGEHIGPLVRLLGPRGEHARVLDIYKRLAESLGRFGRGLDRISLLPRGEWRLEFTSGLVLIPASPLDVGAVTDMVRVLPGILGDQLEGVAVLDFRYANGFAVRWRDEEPVETSALRSRRAPG